MSGPQNLLSPGERKIISIVVPVVLSKLILFSWSGLNANKGAAENTAMTRAASVAVRIVVLLRSSRTHEHRFRDQRCLSIEQRGCQEEEARLFFLSK